MNYENEVWKPVPGYEGHYEVSDMGRVRTIKTGIIRKQGIVTGGYLAIRLCLNGIAHNHSMHRLVYSAFNGEIPSDKDVDHIDGCRTNNAISNLGLLSHIDNCRSAYIRRRSLGKTMSKYMGVQAYTVDGHLYFRVRTTYEGKAQTISNHKCEQLARCVAELALQGIFPPKFIKRMNDKKNKRCGQA